MDTSWRKGHGGARLGDTLLTHVDSVRKERLTGSARASRPPTFAARIALTEVIVKRRARRRTRLNPIPATCPLLSVNAFRNYGGRT